MAPSGNTSATSLNELVKKLGDVDPDIRFMSLDDMTSMLQIGSEKLLLNEHRLCNHIVDGLLHTLVDQNGDVQNNTIKCLGPFVTRAPVSIVAVLIDKLVNLNTEQSLDNSVVLLAMRAVIVALPRPVPGISQSASTKEIYAAVSHALIPHLTQKLGKTTPSTSLLRTELETGQDNNGLDVLTEIARCYGPMLNDNELSGLQNTLTEVLLNPRCGSVLKRKANHALAVLSKDLSDAQLGAFISFSIEILRQATPVQPQTKAMLNAFAALAKTIPNRFGPYLQTIVPFVLSPLSQDLLDRQQVEADDSDDVGAQLEDTREAALTGLDTFQNYCPAEMRPFGSEVIEAARRFIRYDPNYNEDIDAMETDEDDLDLDNGDEDFEEETGFDDEDDVTWKLRRCSAKLLHSQVSQADILDDSVTFESIATSLIQKCNDREESVRLEVMATLNSLIKMVGSRDATHSSSNQMAPLVGRKRRLDEYDCDNSANGFVSPTVSSYQSKAQDSLAKISPGLVQKLVALVSSGTSSSTEAGLVTLAELAQVQQSRPLLNVAGIIDAAVGSLSSAGESAHSLRSAALRLLRATAETHSSTLLQLHLQKIVETLLRTAVTRYSQVACDSLTTIETYIKVITPPRSAAKQSSSSDLLNAINNTLQRIAKSDVDVEVRSSAIKAIGLLIGRTIGTGLLNDATLSEARNLVAERLHNELTRLAAIGAITTIASMSSKSSDLGRDWLADVVHETSAQLRKADRSLRHASLACLRTLARHISHLDDKTSSSLLRMLLPVVQDSDTTMLTPALVVIGAIIEAAPGQSLNVEVSSALCSVVQKQLTDVALDALLHTIEIVGKSGNGKGLMTALLQIATSGNPAIVGQSIGTLLAADASGLGVTQEDFKAQLHKPDETQQCLALYVLGELSMRMGSACLLKPGEFTDFFDSSDKVALAAAKALGRACAGNVATFLPHIIAEMDGPRPYLLLHSTKEALHHAAAEVSILQHADQLWQKILVVAQSGDNNKTVGAECIGRLVVIDPTGIIPRIAGILNDKSPDVRGMVISALNFTFAEPDARFNASVEPMLPLMLCKMLEDDSIDNKRLALMAFGSALRNKPQAVLPVMDKLLALVLQETYIHKDLVRTVNMGPFKHEVDSGLETRRSAYNILYLAMDTSSSQIGSAMNIVLDRIVAGFADEHEIKLICCLTLSRLVKYAPEVTKMHLDELAEAFRKILAFKPKDNTVKHELEKIGERTKAILKVSVQINKTLATNIHADGSRAWREYWEWVKVEKGAVLKGVEDDLRDRNH